MPDMMIVAEAVASPTSCAWCASHSGPFVDAGIEHLGHGRLYVCRLCAEQMGRLFGMLEAGPAQLLRVELDAMVRRVEALERELLEREDVRLVRLSELSSLVGEHVRGLLPSQPPAQPGGADDDGPAVTVGRHRRRGRR